MDHNQITEQEILNVQEQWARGIEEIGAVFVNKGEYKARAKEHIKNLYAYDQGDVLFKPTLASDQPFRPTFDQALSYFVGGDIPEDSGFATTPWSKVRFGAQQIKILPDMALAMGNYYFTPMNDTKETKVEFTFGYVRNEVGNLCIILHHSSMPFAKAA